jgi:5-methylcytosine-specific restriction endonuclease McrA
VTDRITGRRRQERNRRILAASDICHICGNPGADSVDHVIPLARGGTEHAHNLAPAHHDVPPFCNRVKGAREYAPILRRSRSLTRPQGETPPDPPTGHFSA